MYEQIAKSKDWLYPIFRIYVMIPSVKQKETGVDRLTMVPTREFAWIFCLMHGESQKNSLVFAPAHAHAPGHCGHDLNPLFWMKKNHPQG